MNSSLERQQQALQAAICADPSSAGGVQAALGLEVYRHAYVARLIAALRDNYEVLHRAMGDEGFEALARAYLAAHPSSRPSIRWFGHRLPEFMADWPELAHPAFADLARMDRALRDAFDAADAPSADATLELTAETVLQPHPSLHLVELQWQVEPAWRVLREAITEEAGDEAELPPPEEGEHLLLAWRRGLEVQWRSVPDAEAPLLQALMHSAELSGLGEIAGDAQTLVAALRLWVAEGLLLQTQ